MREVSAEHRCTADRAVASTRKCSARSLMLVRRGGRSRDDTVTAVAARTALGGR